MRNLLLVATSYFDDFTSRWWKRSSTSIGSYLSIQHAETGPRAAGRPLYRLFVSSHAQRPSQSLALWWLSAMQNKVEAAIGPRRPPHTSARGRLNASKGAASPEVHLRTVADATAGAGTLRRAAVFQPSANRPSAKKPPPPVEPPLRADGLQADHVLRLWRRTAAPTWAHQPLGVQVPALSCLQVGPEGLVRRLTPSSHWPAEGRPPPLGPERKPAAWGPQLFLEALELSLQRRCHDAGQRPRRDRQTVALPS